MFTWGGKRDDLQINDPSFQLKKLEKEQQSKLKVVEKANDKDKSRK